MADMSLMSLELQTQQLQALQQQVAAADPTQAALAATAPGADAAAAAAAAAADPNQLAALGALGVMPQMMMMPGLTTGGLTGLTGMPGVGTDPMAVASLGALGPQYAAAAQAAAANATALYYQALQGLGLSPAALGLATPAAETPAPTGRSFNIKPGDWNCKACGDLQFARNTKCRRCGAPKPSQEELDAAGPPTKPHSNMAPDGRPMRPGDWACPNCGDHNFARNTQCRKCGTPRPADVTEFPKPVAEPTYTPDGRQMRPGDWICENCGDHNFARNQQCRKCGHPRPSEVRPSGADLAAMAAAGTLPPVNPAYEGHMKSRERSRSRG
eukprot:symbB.v1.2.001057.t1/scaffold33.1/size517934/9